MKAKVTIQINWLQKLKWCQVWKFSLWSTCLAWFSNIEPRLPVSSTIHIHFALVSKPKIYFTLIGFWVEVKELREALKIISQDKYSQSMLLVSLDSI